MQPTGAEFFDGETAGRHSVFVALSKDRQALEITGQTLPGALQWKLPDLRALHDTADPSRLILTRLAETTDEAPRDPARLVIHDPDLIAWLHRTRPNLFKQDLHKGTGRKAVKYAAGAVVAALMMLFVILPAMANTLARILPIEREIAFGKTVTAQMERVLGGTRIGALHCDDPAGNAALQAMLRRLTAGQQMRYDIELQVLDHPMINAFAAPGGQVVILRGLLDKASGPDEVAGVLAHELGHVEARDATRNALRAAGSAGLLSMLIGDFTGGALFAILGEHMINASYTRDAEGQADAFALRMLDNSGVSATGFAAFFDVIDAELGGLELPGYLATHPVTAERAEQARSFAESQSDTNPILNRAEWQALQRICD
ncbi:M48 family metallopeptidase [Tropicibacter oceani]|uniref:M48 family metallopeptidase n=1 Tax=Tropicibacter oceani TaxID=3058420 RepID=A0ABY8QKP6_9RHOB|nr:M48 family metallopeptidase [Tropicibacter oceani]WGW05182.1 M48 family metallopeptidase [Tropicibacter oceani]